MRILRLVSSARLLSTVGCCWLGGLLASPATAQWIETLPAEAQASVLWVGDLEEGHLDDGDFYDWEYYDFTFPGGGVFNTGDADEAISIATDSLAHSGRFSAEATIHNAFRAQNGAKAIRLMRWTDRPWDDGGEFLPNEAYFSTWMYFPHAYNPNKYPPWDPGDGGWWNVFQFKSDDDQGESQPIFTLNVDHDDEAGEMSFYLYSRYNAPNSFPAQIHRPIPVGQWMHLEALYKQSASTTGEIKIWQDGELILDVVGVRTILAGNAVWGIGNYTDHIAGGPEEGSATIYFDDCVVSTIRLSTFNRLFGDGFETGDTTAWWTSVPP